MNIFVGNLSFKTSEEELQKAFENFGEVASVKIILDHETLKSRGFAFVTMPDQEQATTAIAGLNGKDLNGFALRVNESRPRGSEGGPPQRSQHGSPSDSGYQGRPNYSSNSGGGGGGYNRNRTSPGISMSDLEIYDTKGGSGGRKGKGGSNRRSGGRGGDGRSR